MGSPLRRPPWRLARPDAERGVALLHHRVQKGSDLGDEPRSLRRDQEARAPLDPESIAAGRDPPSLAVVEKHQVGVEPVRGHDDCGFSRAELLGQERVRCHVFHGFQPVGCEDGHRSGSIHASGRHLVQHHSRHEDRVI
jgi:hypothetical protein